MEKRKFSKKEKLSILKKASEQGEKNTLDKYGLYPSTYYSWKKKFESMGEAGFRQGMPPEHSRNHRFKSHLRSSLANAIL